MIRKASRPSMERPVFNHVPMHHRVGRRGRIARAVSGVHGGLSDALAIVGAYDLAPLEHAPVAGFGLGEEAFPRLRDGGRLDFQVVLVKEVLPAERGRDGDLVPAPMAVRFHLGALEGGHTVVLARKWTSSFSLSYRNWYGILT